MKRRTLAALAIVGVFSGAVMGDKILARGNYEVPLLEVTGFQEGRVAYLSQSHKTRHKALRDILQLTLDRQGTFTQAEQRRQENQYPEAMELYESVISGDSPAWIKQIARYRAVDMAQKTGRIDLAMRVWLEIISSGPGNEALGSVPQTFAPKGDLKNAAAIEALETYLATAKDKTVRRTIRKLLITICRHEGLNEKADMYAMAIEDQVLQATQGPEALTPTSGAKNSQFAAMFLAAGQLVRPDQKPQALREQIEKLQANLNTYSAQELSPAMLLIGKAKMYLGQQEADALARRALLLEAGLTLMRAKVAAQRPEIAAEALYQTGRVNELIGNRRAAQAAYRAVLSRYAQAQDIVQKATKALEKLLDEGDEKPESVGLDTAPSPLQTTGGGTTG